MQTIRWGILGPGKQSTVMVPEIRLVEGSEVTAVASRSQTRADAFAAEHGIDHAFGSLADMLASGTVDVVYVGTPHGVHTDDCLEIIASGTPLLIDKSMAATPEDVRRIVDAARAKGVFCMEAMWTRFQPVVEEARRRVGVGEIGDVRAVVGDLTAHRAHDPSDRLFAPELGGGALLDLGVYVAAFAHDFLGAPDDVKAVGHRLENGVDGTCAMVWSYADGRSADLSVSFETYGPGRMAVLGTQGWIDVLPRFHHPDTIVVHREGHMDETVTLMPEGRGYTHEVRAVNQAVRDGRSEHERFPLQASIEIADVLAAAARQIG